MADLNFDFSGEAVATAQSHVTPEIFRNFQDFRFGTYSTHWDDAGDVVKTVGRNPVTGERYSPNRLETSMSFEEAFQEVEYLKAEQPNKVHGLILYMPENLVCVDLDDTDAPTTPALTQQAHYDILDRAPTWTERSVSGVGYHAFYWLSDIEAAQLSNTNNGEKKVDTRVVNGFVFLTGDVVSDPDMGFADFSTLPENFQNYLFKRCALAKEAAQGSNAQWHDNPKHTDFEVMVQMFRRCPETANYMYKNQSQTGGSDMHYQVVMDLIQCSLNYEQVLRLYTQSPCAEYMNRSENRAGLSRAQYEGWLKRNINAAAADLEASGRMFNPEDIEIAFGEEDGEKEFPALWTDDVTEYTQTEWIIHNVLPARGVASVYGPSGSGKTFLALDMLAAVASGHDWFGRKTRQVPVTYVGLEGEAGLRNRVYAYRIHHGNMGRMMMLTNGLNILKSEDMEKLIRTIYKNKQRQGVICIDTLAKSAPGMNENDMAEMSKYLVAVETLARETQCVVILIHHSGKDTERGPRGSSAFLAGIDSAIEVKRDRDSGIRSWSTKKVKDGADNIGANFVLKGVQVGTDQWGQPDMSCVIDAAPDLEAFTSNLSNGPIAQGNNGISDEDCALLADFMFRTNMERFTMKPGTREHVHAMCWEMPGWPGWDRNRVNALLKAGATRHFFEIFHENDQFGYPHEYVKLNR
jgi:KaiC/GvpD/RAD55 family RecA-like ATPase